MTKTTQFFAVHDDSFIYGVGPTSSKAMAEWRTGVGSDQRDNAHGSIIITEMTPALFGEVSAQGGAITWDEIDGIACTEAEYALDQAAPLMDDAIREDIHSNFENAPDAAAFLAEYERRHEAQFGEQFDV